VGEKGKPLPTPLAGNRRKDSKWWLLYVVFMLSELGEYMWSYYLNNP
jgi:hypothetical protein